jgi:hypothetical protein
LGGYCAVAAGGLGGKVSHWARLAVGVALGLLAWGALGSTLAVLKIGWGAPYRFTAPLVLAAFLAPLVIGPLGVRRAGRLRAALTNRAGLSVLALLHLARVLGLVFLPLHASGELPAHFAYPAAWGDVASALAAPLAAWAAWFHYDRLGDPGSPWRRVFIGFNLLGLADHLYAVGAGIGTFPGPIQLVHTSPSTAVFAALPMILFPIYLVPFVDIGHLIMLDFLRRSTSRPQPSPTPAERAI